MRRRKRRAERSAALRREIRRRRKERYLRRTFYLWSRSLASLLLQGRRNPTLQQIKELPGYAELERVLGRKLFATST